MVMVMMVMVVGFGSCCLPHLSHIYHEGLGCYKNDWRFNKSIPHKEQLRWQHTRKLLAYGVSTHDIGIVRETLMTRAMSFVQR